MAILAQKKEVGEGRATAAVSRSRMRRRLACQKRFRAVVRPPSSRRLFTRSYRGASVAWALACGVKSARSTHGDAGKKGIWAGHAAVMEHVERAVRAVLIRNGVLVLPVAARVGVEVVARVGGRVHVREEGAGEVNTVGGDARGCHVAG